MPEFQFSPFPVLTTERLTLRRPEPGDDRDIFRLRSDESVNQFLGRKIAETREDARQFIATIAKTIENGEGVYWAITLKNDDRVIGTICYFDFSDEKERAEIGYELLPEFQGKGIMQEALSEVIRFGFEEMKLQTILAFTRIDHLKSAQLLERNNFRIDADMNTNEEFYGDLANMAVYALKKDNYASRLDTGI